MTSGDWGFADRFAFFRFNSDAWDLFRTAALAVWPLNVERASNWELLAMRTWHECPIARVTAADELRHRGVLT